MLSVKSGVDLFESLESEALEYFKIRRLQVKSLAKLKSTTEVQILIYPVIEKFASDLDAVYLKDVLNIEWLTNLMVSVQPDSEKLKEAVSHIKRHFSGRINSQALDDLIKQFLVYVKEDFNSMRSMKQSIYYRSRSLNSVFKFFETCDTSFKNLQLKNNSDVQEYLTQLKDRFLLKSDAERYTKNSYLGEFFSFIADVEPNFLPESESATIKSLDAKFVQNLSNLENISSNNFLVKSAYEEFSSLIPQIVKRNGDGDTSINSLPEVLGGSNSGDKIQIHLRKGAEVEISFKSSSNSQNRILKLEESLLLELLNEKEFPDISIDSSRASLGQLSLVCSADTTPSQLLKLRTLMLKLSSKI